VQVLGGVMGTAVKAVMGVVGVVAVWLALATTLFGGTGPAGPGPEPRACVAGTAPPAEDVRVEHLLATSGPAGVTACTRLVPSR
jgi:hypothetical protein